MDAGPPELEKRYRRFLEGRGDAVDPLICYLRGDGHARAETGAWAALIISRIFLLKGNVNISLSYLRIASSCSKHSKTETLRLGILVNRALILKARGRTREAANLLRAIVDRALTSNEIFVAAKAASNLALCIARCGEPRDASSYLGLAERAYSALGYETGLIRLNMTRSILEARGGMFDEAIERIVGALNKCGETRFDREKVIGRLLLAEIFLNRGDLEKARSALDSAASMDKALRRFGAQRSRYYCLERELNEKTGNVEESHRFMQLAEGLKHRLGIAPFFPGISDRQGRGYSPSNPARKGCPPVARESAPQPIAKRLEVHHAVRVSSEPGVPSGGRAFAEARACNEARAFGGVRARAEEFVTCDPRMGQLLDEVRLTARLSVPILLQGESGTGKDLIARLIHFWSGRGDEPFVPVNVAALPIELFESMTFGHARGAFTGAACRRPGLVESAGRGTILLDEIGELSPAAQVKLLRLVDKGEFIPLGETTTRRNEARIVAATNRDLKAYCVAGGFRADLYYRLAALAYTIPPLRERRMDIGHLAEHILGKISAQYGLGDIKLHEDVLELLSSHDWPGNARELESEILKAALKVAKGTIRTCHLSPGLIMGDGRRTPLLGNDLRTRINSSEKAEIIEALCRFGGNRSKAAFALGLKRTTLLSAMKRLGVDW